MNPTYDHGRNVGRETARVSLLQDKKSTIISWRIGNLIELHLELERWQRENPQDPAWQEFERGFTNAFDDEVKAAIRSTKGVR